MTYPLPDAALDSDIAILGRKGGGKTITAKGIVERLLDKGQRVLVLDPLGVWAGLRSSADGKKPGYPIAIFGGEHADLPLERSSGAALAQIIGKNNLPAIIDLSDLTKAAQNAFLQVFLHDLRRANSEALTVVLEEADVFAPQNPQGDDSKVLHGEIDWIARRGRSRGFRLITITQRPARLSKDVLTQAATLIVHKLPAPQDREAVKAWVDGNGDRDQAKAVVDSLASLEVGQAWVWAPDHGILEIRRFPMIKTLDTSSTPKAGDKRMAAISLADVDVSAIRSALEISASSSEAGKVSRVELASPGEIKTAEQRGYDRGLAEARQQHHSDLQKITQAVFAARMPLQNGLMNIEGFIATQIKAMQGDSDFREVAIAPAAQQSEMILPLKARTSEAKVARAKPQREPSAAPVAFNSAAVKMLKVLDTKPPVLRSWQQIATLAGLKANGGHFNTGRKALIDSGVIALEDGLVRVAKPSAGAPSSVTDPAALVEIWASALDGAAPKILRRLFAMGGKRDRDDIAVDLGMKPSGGHWNTGWKQLRDNDIVLVEGGVARLTDPFMPIAPTKRRPRS